MTCPNRVFLCDDDRGYRALVRAVLEPAGALIVGEACDGAECIDRLPEAQPDLILLDEKMPGMNGLTALPRIREVTPDARVVFLTTADARVMKSRALEAGADAFVRKPGDILTLPKMLHEALT